MTNLLMASGGSSTWVMLLVLGGLMVVMMMVSIIPQRKRRKQAQEMLSKIGKGDTIKTIGGFFGEVIAVDTASYVLNIGTADAPIVVTIDKAAVYTVVKSVNTPEPVVVETTDGDKVLVEEEVKTLDDATDDAKRAEKAKQKADKKANKSVEKNSTDTEKSDSEPIEVQGEVVNNNNK